MKAELKPEELRVNSYYQYLSGDPFQLGMDDFGRLKDLPKHLWPQPIELSEEWLIKAKFESKQINTHEGKQLYWIKNENGKYFEIDVWPKSVHGTNVFMYYYSLTVHLASVHQLQNLYYALTGNELIFNHG